MVIVDWAWGYLTAQIELDGVKMDDCGLIKLVLIMLLLKHGNTLLYLVY